MRRRHRKFKRDKLNFNQAREHDLKLMKGFEDLKLLPSNNNNSDLCDNNNNLHHPIILTDSTNDIIDNLKSLFAKGPSFVPTPLNYDWLQLQKDFDVFKSRLRAQYIFKESEQINIRTDLSLPPPPKKSTWVVPKTTSPQLETVISNAEKELFADTSYKRVKDNLTKGERDSLNNWRKKKII